MRTRTLAVIGLVAALTLSACSDDSPEPRFEPESSSAAATTTPSSPTTEASETEAVEPTLPPEAQEATKAGLEAFVAFYWKVVDYAEVTGDVQLLRTLSVDDCKTCAGGIEAIEDVYERGGRITGGTYELVSMRAFESDETPGAWIVAASVRVGRQVVRGAGNLNETYPAGTQDLAILAEYDADRWQIASWETS